MGGDPHELKTAGASVAGPGHLARGVACQDAFAYAVGERGTVIAVADGLGSAERSDRGARVAVDAAAAAGASLLAHPCRVPLHRVATSMTMHARRAVEALRDAQRCELRSLASTLVLVVVQDRIACAAHVGDGAVVVRVPHGYVLLSGPADSEYANEVEPLTADTFASSVRVSMIGGVDFVAVLTDGCQHAALRPATREPHAGFLEPLRTYLLETPCTSTVSADLADLLAGARLSEHSDDDKTLVLAATP